MDKIVAIFTLVAGMIQPLKDIVNAAELAFGAGNGEHKANLVLQTANGVLEAAGKTVEEIKFAQVPLRSIIDSIVAFLNATGAFKKG